MKLRKGLAILGTCAIPASLLLLASGATQASGSISFSPAVNFTVGPAPVNIALGDLDGDGKPDVAVTNTGSNYISLLRNTGSAGTVSFAAKVDLTTNLGPIGIALADIDQDGKLDIVVTEY